MSNFDLIDDYIANRLSESDRSMFEAGMNADPALKSEVETQSMIIEGIRKARAAELKAMLNKVPVGGAISLWGDWSVMKMAATIGVAGIIGTSLYFYVKDSNEVINNVPKAEVPIDSLIPKATEEPVITEPNKEEGAVEKETEVTTPKTQRPKPRKIAATTPKVVVEDPSSELLSGTKTTDPTSVSTKAVISVATIQVERPANTKYTFHYQFTDKKLFLYGPFEGVLYEILEVHGDNHALFLYFKDNFYHLDENKLEATDLTPIRDRALIQKLKEFRNPK
jgi:hypothetical protein